MHVVVRYFYMVDCQMGWSVALCNINRGIWAVCNNFIFIGFFGQLHCCDLLFFDVRGCVSQARV